MASLQSIMTGTLKMKGPVTSVTYTWPHALYIHTAVDAADVLGLLAKAVTTQPCCGGRATTHHYVQEV